jgi:hypothetical protein
MFSSSSMARKKKPTVKKTRPIVFNSLASLKAFVLPRLSPSKTCRMKQTKGGMSRRHTSAPADDARGCSMPQRVRRGNDGNLWVAVRRMRRIRGTLRIEPFYKWEKIWVMKKTPAKKDVDGGGLKKKRIRKGKKEPVPAWLFGR